MRLLHPGRKGPISKWRQKMFAVKDELSIRGFIPKTKTTSLKRDLRTDTKEVLQGSITIIVLYQRSLKLKDYIFESVNASPIDALSARLPR